ncbi:MAG TPA: beta-galactosidase [Anaerolineae bacterium]|nr:beta-galactosidase [Anaerolineae bacterium]HMR62372.1 beta-galactosidase [Anaerolineae bacterium]
MSKQLNSVPSTDASTPSQPSTYFETAEPPFFAAEFDYFRLPAERWSLLLTRLRQMGCQIVSVGVPWLWHEIEPGQVDLTGASSPRRNLAGLLKLCRALQLTCLIDLGPLTERGLLNNGLPLWLSEETRAEAVERWLRAVSQPLVDAQWPNGPVVALQIDPHLFQPPQPTVNAHLVEVKWPIWLRKKYGSVEALNAAYGTAYTTISRVEFPQPQVERKPTSPAEVDAQTFLATQRRENQTNQQQLLRELGWQVPLLSSPADQDSLPRVHNLTISELSELKRGQVIYNLQQPVQADPDPSDIGTQPVWARHAPIQTDGSVRRTFYLARHAIWPFQISTAQVEDQLLSASIDNGGLLSGSQDSGIRLPLPPGSKPTPYRLRLTGELLVDTALKPARSKLSGFYLLEDEVAQNDLVLWLNDPTAGLDGFPGEYLGLLLAAQAFSLAHSATMADSLSHSLAVEPEASKPRPAPAKPAVSTYTLDEARRGLREADAALRKALRSVGGLQAGFETILGRREPEAAAAAQPPVVVTPAIFEGAARDALIEAGQVCAKIGPDLQATAEALQSLRSARFSLKEYQEGYSTAIATAATVRTRLLAVIAGLRIKIASEQLPLVAWRVLDQVQMIAEELRWGVERG